jgi:restriction endonuclease S subunit
MRTASINNKIIQTHNLRFEGRHFLNINSYLSLKLEKNESKCVPLESVAIVFNPPVFKRQFCTKAPRSVQYFQSSDVQMASEESPTYIFRGQAEQLNLLVKEGDILVTGFGTIGNVRIVSKFQNDVCYANNVCRIRTNGTMKRGFLYAFLSSIYGNAQLNKNASGSVVKYIEAPGIKKTLIPKLPESFQKEVDDLIQESARLREEATDALEEAQRLLKREANLRDLTPEDYDYYGSRNSKRDVSCFTINRKDITTTTINAFNLSARIRKTKQMMHCEVMPLKDTLVFNDTFSTGSFPRIEVKKGYGIMLINQSDIFDTIVKGKYISKRNVKIDNLIEYGEVLIAGVGTLGENETFCRCIFANEDLVGQLVSGEFIRMKTNNKIPSGYLFAWLSTEYGFRFIRNLQAGTKLCRPIPRLLLEIPVPIVSNDKMNNIDVLVRNAHTKRYQANCKERKAISLVESEIEKWDKN